MPSISMLRTFVQNGWTIANRRTVTSQIGKSNFDAILSLAKKGKLKKDIFELSSVGEIKPNFQIITSPITKQEYEKLINELRLTPHIDIETGKLLEPLLVSNIEKYPNIAKEFEGIIPYAGFDKGFHHVINRIISGLPIKYSRLVPTNIADFIKCLEYSLLELDKKCGLHNGIVYRVGFFNPACRQYYSASTSTDLCEFFRPDSVLNIIKVKNGHKIYDFQKKFLSRGIHDQEKEVLMSPKSSFRELKKRNDYNTEIMDFAREYKNTIMYMTNLSKRKASSLLNEYQQVSEKSVEEIASRIKVWEEI